MVLVSQCTIVLSSWGSTSAGISAENVANVVVASAKNVFFQRSTFEWLPSIVDIDSRSAKIEVQIEGRRQGVTKFAWFTAGLRYMFTASLYHKVWY